MKVFFNIFYQLTDLLIVSTFYHKKIFTLFDCINV